MGSSSDKATITFYTSDGKPLNFSLESNSIDFSTEHIDTDIYYNHFTNAEATFTLTNSQFFPEETKKYYHI